MPAKTYRGPLWKYVHPFKYLKGEARIARRQMHPARIAWRVFGTGKAMPTWRTKTTRANTQTRQRDVQRATKPVARKATAKKTAATKATQPRAATAAAVKRKKNGQFNGREAMPAHERVLFDRAEQRYVDPRLVPRSARSRKQRPAGY